MRWDCRPIHFRCNNVRAVRVWSGVVPATLVAGLLLISTSCAALTSRQTNSPQPSASAVQATPGESPAAVASPSTTTTPSPSSVTDPLAKLLIRTLPFHAAEVGVAYAPAVMGAT